MKTADRRTVCDIPVDECELANAAVPVATTKLTKTLQQEPETFHGLPQDRRYTLLFSIYVRAAILDDDTP